MIGWLGSSAKDCGPTLLTVSTTDTEVFTDDGNLCLKFNMDFSDLKVGKNQEVVYTPVLLNSDNNMRAEFGKIVVKGKNMALTSKRHGSKKIENVAYDIAQTKGALPSISYSGSVPYEPWMKNSTLYLVEDLCGCGNFKSQDKKELAAVGKAPVAPVPETPAMAEVPGELRVEDIRIYVQPQIEDPKIRYESGSAYVDFIVNKYNIDPKYHDNAAEIQKIISSIDLVKRDKNVHITNVDIHGYASPEGAYKHNEWLAQKRTEALVTYVNGLYPIQKSLLTTQSTAENWEGLKKYVTESSIPYRDEILFIIDDPYMTPDQKDAAIRKDYPMSYEFMLKQWYPWLRRTDYTISYEVRPFSPEEALQIMRVSPNQVSLYEMFMAAQSLGVNTDAYNDIIELAVATYPNEPAANYNAAVVAINKGENEQARKYLAKVPETADTLNLLGVIELNSGNYAAAANYFNKAIERGSTQAVKNLKLIESLN